MRSNKENFLIAGIICLVSGAFFTVAGLFAFSTTVGIGGLIFVHPWDVSTISRKQYDRGRNQELEAKCPENG